MEKNQEHMKNKNMSTKFVTNGGGGLAGIILLGGALATAALVSTFAFKTKKKSKIGDEDDCLRKSSKVVKKDGDGLSFLVQDSLSPQLDHQCHLSSAVEHKRDLCPDDTSQVNGEKDEEIDILEKAREGLFCDESVTSMEEFPVQFADISLLRKPDEMKKNDRLEENAVLRAAEKIPMSDDDQHILLKEEEVLVEVPQSEQLGIDDDYQKRGDECDGNGQVLVEKREGLVKAAVENKIRADDKPYKGGEECDADVGVTIEKGEELVGDVAANGIQLGEKLEFITMYGDQDILCSDSTVIQRHENGTRDVNQTNLLLPMTESLSLLKPADNDLLEKLLVIEDTEILEGGEADKTSVQEDSIKVEDSGETQFVEPDEDEIGNDQQMQSCEEFQNDKETKYGSDKSSPETSSFSCNGFEVQEFSFPLLDSPSYFNFGDLIKDDYSQTALHVEDVNTMEKDRSANEVFSYQIMSEKKAQSTNNAERKSYSDNSENDFAEGEETPETGLANIGDGSRNDEEALEIIGTENFELQINQQPLLEENTCYDDNVNREKVSDSSEDEENSDSDCVEEHTDDEDEESSETTGGSSLDSNAEAIWPVASVQEFSRKVKPIQENHNFMETEKGDGHPNLNKHNVEEEDKEGSEKGFSNKLTAEITTLRQPTMFSNLRFWFLSLLVPFLLLLWLLSSRLSSGDSSCRHIQ